jgi:hypothetical protein
MAHALTRARILGDLFFAFLTKGGPTTKVKGGGQECPLHMGIVA